jgi:2-oxoisovalerate dehydrogenase E1 component alpha subunit
MAALRVDGNDFLAVYAATQWAAERARAISARR